jgi:hypothetical protein
LRRQWWYCRTPGRGDAHRNLVDLAHGVGDPLDGLGGAPRRGLYCSNLAADLLGRLGGLRGQRFDLGGHDCKALAGVAGARRLEPLIGRVMPRPITRARPTPMTRATAAMISSSSDELEMVARLFVWAASKACLSDVAAVSS